MRLAPWLLVLWKEEWNYKKGTIIISEIGKIEITKEGNLKDGEHIYENSESFKYYSESGSNALEISDLTVTSNSSYTTCHGRITNHGKKVYKNIDIKGAFKDKRENVIDNDWTIAVGNEGLEAGESKTFSLSVPRNSNIVNCSVKIIDYDF